MNVCGPVCLDRMDAAFPAHFITSLYNTFLNTLGITLKKLKNFFGYPSPPRN